MATPTAADMEKAREIVEWYNSGFVWDENLATARRPGLVRAIAQALADHAAQAVADERERCARIAESPYSDEVGAIGGRQIGDEPLAVGKKIAAALRGPA